MTEIIGGLLTKNKTPVSQNEKSNAYVLGGQPGAGKSNLTGEIIE